MKKWLIHIALIVSIVAAGNIIAYKIIHVPVQMELVALFSLVLFYPVLRKPLVGVYALFIILPFIPHLRRLYYLLYSRPKLDPLIIVGDILIMFIFLGLFFEFKDNQEKYRPVRAYILIITGYVAYLLLRVFAFNSQELSESVAKFKLYGPPVLAFFVGIVYAHRFNHLKRLWAITIAIGLVSCLYGFKQLHFGYSEAEQIWFNSISFTTLFIQGIARPFSFFQAPVAFADYQQLAIIGVLMVSSWKMKFSKIVLFTTPLFFYAVLITSVRSSWIGIMVTFLIWLTMFHLKGNTKRLLVLGCTALVFALFEFIAGTVRDGLSISGFFDLAIRILPNQQFLDLLVTERTTALENPLGEHSLLSRFVLWKTIFITSADPINALVGRGLGALKADSLYMTYLAEFGYPGFLFIILLLATFIKNGLSLMDSSNNSDVQVLAKGITVMNLVFALISVTGTHIHYFPGDLYFWFWNGVLVMLFTTHKLSVRCDHETVDNH